MTFVPEFVRRPHARRPNWQQLTAVAPCPTCGEVIALPLFDPEQAKSERFECQRCHTSIRPNQPLEVPSQWKIEWRDLEDITERLDNGQPWRTLVITGPCWECGHVFSSKMTHSHADCPRCGRRRDHCHVADEIEKTLAAATTTRLIAATAREPATIIITCPSCAEDSPLHFRDERRTCPRCYLQIVTEKIPGIRELWSQAAQPRPEIM